MTVTENEAARWLSERDNFLILTHVRPDGDTLGCAAGLCAALKKLGKTAWAAANPGVTSTYLGDIVPYFAPEDYIPQHIVAVDIATRARWNCALTTIPPTPITRNTCVWTPLPPPAGR